MGKGRTPYLNAMLGSMHMSESQEPEVVFSFETMNRTGGKEGSWFVPLFIIFSFFQTPASSRHPFLSLCLEGPGLWHQRLRAPFPK